MITVLHTESSTGWGGQENRTIHECMGLKALGVRPMILCRPGSRIYSKAGEVGVEAITSPMRGSYDVISMAEVMRLIDRESIDVINTHSGSDSFIGAVAGRLSRRKPVVVRTRHLALPITSKTTYSLFPHKIVTVSDYVRRYLVDHVGIRADKVVSIPTGIDLERFDPHSTPDTLRDELGIDRTTTLVGTVAIFRRKKGYHVLLGAIAEVLKIRRDVIFVFAGDGPQRENILRGLKDLGIERNVRLLGLRSDVPVVLKGIDLFVLPTLQEALGTSFLEAMAMGKAVIGTRVGGVPEVVRDGVDGLLVEPGDERGLADAILRLLEDRHLRLSMGTRGRKRVEENFSTQRMVEGMYNLYVELLGRGRVRRW